MKHPHPSTREALTEELSARFSWSGRWRQRLARSFHTVTWFAVLAGLAGLKRALDFCLALALIVITLPVTGCIVLLSRLRDRQPLLRRTRRAGRWCEPFDELSFSGSPRLFRAIPALVNILKGDMSFVGPRAVSPGELTPRERQARKRYSARPGLVCLWWIRQRANIAYSVEAASDVEYVESQTIGGDFGIALRAIPALLYGEGVAVSEDVVSILGISLDNMTMSDAIEWIVARAAGNSPGQICFVNADCANLVSRNPDYMAVLRDSQLALADGIGMKLAGKLLGREIRQNVNGTDLFPRLCESLSGTGAGIFLLGARPGFAEKVRDWIVERYPSTLVSGYHDGYFSAEEEPEVIREIARSRAAILLVAFGSPRQDLWIHRHLAATGVKVAMGVGGLFDFYSGRIPRAPLWMREVGAEWLYRFYQEPRRMWRRYFVGNAIFLWRVVRARHSPNPSAADAVQQRPVGTKNRPTTVGQDGILRAGCVPALSWDRDVLSTVPECVAAAPRSAKEGTQV
jgi:N-acetylglucosaminyldiphosphoundecaprenol N-acetyl-beta-D-mannosaminyltransferase